MKITKEMGITEVVQEYPETIDIFLSFGMACIGCAAAAYESIEQGANAHGVDSEQLVKSLNEAIA